MAEHVAVSLTHANVINTISEIGLRINDTEAGSKGATWISDDAAVGLKDAFLIFSTLGAEVTGAAIVTHQTLHSFLPGRTEVPDAFCLSTIWQLVIIILVAVEIATQTTGLAMI